MSPVIRTMVPSDVPRVVEVLNASYGIRPNFESRVRRYSALEPEGWLVAESDALLVGVGGYVAFGECAYIGCAAGLGHESGVKPASAASIGAGFALRFTPLRQ